MEEVLSTGCTGGVCAFRLQLRSVITTPVWLAVRIDLHACMRSSAPHLAHLLPRLACFLPDTRGLYMYAGVSTLQSRELLITFFPLASYLGPKSIVTCTPYRRFLSIRYFRGQKSTQGDSFVCKVPGDVLRATCRCVHVPSFSPDRSLIITCIRSCLLLYISTSSVLPALSCPEGENADIICVSVEALEDFRLVGLLDQLSIITCIELIFFAFLQAPSMANGLEIWRMSIWWTPSDHQNVMQPIVLRDLQAWYLISRAWRSRPRRTPSTSVCFAAQQHHF